MDRAALERVLALVNGKRSAGHEVRVEAMADDAFTLSFHDEPMPAGSCLDEHFVEIQFALHLHEKVDTGIVGARYDDESGRYLVEYEVVRWDE